PALGRYSGTQQVAGLPGAFADCAPDRWGRNLITKRERALALEGDRRARTLDDVDFLAGVSDITRQGALRFRADAGSAFLDPDHVVPKIIRLPVLMRAAEAAARDGDQELAAVKALLEAGTGSLGGARPKAAVQGAKDRLLIAKFPHPDDDWDVMAWEATALDLAKAAGVTTPTYELIQLEGRHVLLLERFDRTASGQRIGYMSAMTLLERRDGAGGDYIEIAERIEETGGEVKNDLAELFRRVAVSVGLHNTDDHLRNHGFLRDEGGWVLSPVFDVNPEPDPKQRHTTIAGASDIDDEADGLVELARTCRLRPAQMREELDHITDVLEQWRDAAAANDIGRAEINRFSSEIDRGIAVLRG
ncbi:MAG: HipA domain-containing protein, partial [Lacisediminihabitans sp.]